MTCIENAEIQALLPHRPPFVLVDKIIEFEPRTRIVGLKNVSATDPAIQGHFPENPIYPGVLIIESMIQTATVLFMKDPEFSGRLPTVDHIAELNFKRSVYPGDQLRLEMTAIKVSGPQFTMEAKALVEGRVVCEGQFTFLLSEQPSRPQIHPTASVHASAILGKDVVVGPYSIIGEDVIIGDRTVLEAHVMIEKWTKIGEDCHLYFGAVIGSEAQDVKYHGEKTWVVIGDRNEIREYVTINRSTGKDTITEVGSDNIFLTHVHIAHNCKIGDGVIIANTTNLGGHTVVEDKATIGGMTGIHQFVRIGKGCMVGAYTRLPQDVPPFMLCEGNPAYIRGLNLIGMKRRGVSRKGIQEVKDIFKALYRSDKNTSQALQDLSEQTFETEEAQYVLSFIKADSHRGIIKKSEESSEDAE